MENWASLVAQLVKNPPAMWRPGFDLWVEKIPWRRERLPTPVFWPGEFHERDSPWGSKELDTTERLSKKKTWKTNRGSSLPTDWHPGIFLLISLNI